MIVLKRSLSLIDSVILVIIYAVFIAVVLHAEEAGEEEPAVGVGGRTKQLPQAWKWIATAVFGALGAFILFFGAEPFIESILALARQWGVSEFVLIQWLAPFLSEFPESLTAYVWAAMIVFAPLGLSNLISSKLNQWTLLIAIIPVAYSVGLGRPAAVSLTPRSVDEIFLTAAQSLFGVSLLLPLRFDLRRAALLFALFAAQFVFWSTTNHAVLAWVYLLLVPVSCFLQRRDFRALTPLRQAWAQLQAVAVGHLH